MRMYILLPAVFCSCLVGCGGNKVPPPDEYVRFTYSIAPNITDMPVDISFYAGTQPCGRDNKEIKISATQGKDAVDILLHDAGTSAMPGGATAATITKGKVELNFTVTAPDLPGGVVSFGTADPAYAFTCLLSFGADGADPFVLFDGKFNCYTSPASAVHLTIGNGEVHVTLCPPL